MILQTGSVKATSVEMLVPEYLKNKRFLSTDILIYNCPNSFINIRPTQGQWPLNLKKARNLENMYFLSKYHIAFLFS